MTVSIPRLGLKVSGPPTPEQLVTLKALPNDEVIVVELPNWLLKELSEAHQLVTQAQFGINLFEMSKET